MSILRGKVAQVLWDRIGYLAPRLESEYLDPYGYPRVDKVIDIALFILQAAFGGVFGDDYEFSKRYDRITRRYAANPYMYRLSLADRIEAPIRLVFNDQEHTFSLGRVRGLMVVTPLTAQGYQKYIIKRNRYMSDLLDEVDLSSKEDSYEKHAALVLNTLVHFRSISKIINRQIGLFPRSDSYNSWAYSCVRDYLSHISMFLPSLEISSTDPPGLKTDSGSIPKLICALSGYGMGDREIENLGVFQSIGRDKGGNSLFIFNLQDINDESIETSRRVRMLRAVQLLRYPRVRENLKALFKQPNERRDVGLNWSFQNYSSVTKANSKAIIQVGAMLVDLLVSIHIRAKSLKQPFYDHIELISPYQWSEAITDLLRIYAESSMEVKKSVASSIRLLAHRTSIPYVEQTEATLDFSAVKSFLSYAEEKLNKQISLSHSEDDLKVNVLKIVTENTIFLSQGTEIGYHSKIRIRWFVKLFNAISSNATVSILAQAIIDLVHASRRTGSIDYIAVPKLGNVILASRVASLLGLPLLIIRGNESKLLSGTDLIEGNFENGKKIIIVDDVGADGGYLADIIRSLRLIGDAIVEHVFVVIARRESDETGKNIRSYLLDVAIKLHCVLEMNDRDIEEAMVESNKAELLRHLPSVHSPIDLSIKSLYSNSIELPIDIPIAYELDHTMASALSHYVQQRLPIHEIRRSIAMNELIELHGIYPDHFQDAISHINVTSGCQISNQQKQGSKQTNYIRPTFWRVTNSGTDDKIIVAVPPGRDYLLHYATLISQYAANLKKNGERLISAVHYPCAQDLIAEWTGLRNLPIGRASTIIIGNVEEIIEILATTSQSSLTIVYSSPYYVLWSAGNLFARSDVLFLGVRFSFWGCISSRIVFTLCQMKVFEIIYIGKLGTLTSPNDVYNRIFIPVDFAILRHGKLVKRVIPQVPSRLVDLYPHLLSGTHISVATVLEEDYLQRSLADHLNASTIDNELGKMALAVDYWNQSESMSVIFSSLHYATDYIRKEGERDRETKFSLHNDKTTEARSQKRKMLNTIVKSYLIPYLDKG